MKCELDNISIPLAIKMNFNYGTSTFTYMKLMTEAKMLNKIPNHPNIIFLIHDFYSRPTQEIISACVEVKTHKIMQYNAGTHQNEYRTSLFLMYKTYPSDLEQWMVEKRKDCKMNDIIRICYEISCGILHLWNHGVVHRDLKLNNILIDDEGHIVIIDLGMATDVNVNGKAFVPIPGGNQAHLAPEVLNCDFRREGNIEVDYSKQPSFALGVLFHEILTGYHPFDNYPMDSVKYGNLRNISVPPLDFERINNIKNLVIDDKLTFMIRDLLLPSSYRMTLKECNDILHTLQFAQMEDYSELKTSYFQKVIAAQKICEKLDFGNFSFVKNITLINTGSEGGVMRCEIDNISFPLAIKMHYNYGLETKIYMKLMTEAELLKQIPNHPNIISLIHSFFARPTEKMVFTCVKDQDIRDIMRYKNEYRTSLFLIYKAYPSDLQKWMVEKRKDCKMNDIIRICYEISCGVLHLWNHGVVHRSLKLDDILIDDEGHIVIIDFGMAVKVNSNGKAFVNLPGGSRAHLSPEILNHAFREENIEVDYSKQPSFALGVLFHEIIMGYHPFDNYPFDSRSYGNQPNVRVPVWNTASMTNLVFDITIIEMIHTLLCNSPQDRMDLQTCNSILKDKQY